MFKSAGFRSLHVAFLAAALALSATPGVYGQSRPTGNDTPIGSSGSEGRATDTPSDYVTKSIIKNIGAVRTECASYDPIYRIDCMRQRLLDITRRIPQGAAYAQARQIVGRAASQLGRIQSSAVDASAPRQRSRRNPRLKEAKTYSAVKRETLNRAMQQARQVIEEAETQLLRAGENSEKRASHYHKIAAAVGSTKVLLRSA